MYGWLQGEDYWRLWCFRCFSTHYPPHSARSAVSRVAGDDDRSDISATFIQPFLTYITKTKTTIALNTESTYDWENEEWSVPINFNVLQLLKIGPQIIQVGVGTRYWAHSADNGPEGWGARLQLTLLFPVK